jgi:hypothetical protein
LAVQGDEEVKYRFSRPVRLGAASLGFAFFLGGTIAFLVVRSWEGVVLCLIGVFGVGSLLAQQLGIRIRFAGKLPQGPLARLVLSAAVLALVMALVAIKSDNEASAAGVGSVLFALLLLQFWWEKRRN